MRQDARDEVPGERGGFLGQARTERAALVRLARIGAVEVDLEQRLERQPPRGMPSAARRAPCSLRGPGGGASRLFYAADATPSPITLTRSVATARSATTIAHRIIGPRARPWVTTETPATPRSGAETYGS